MGLLSACPGPIRAQPVFFGLQFVTFGTLGFTFELALPFTRSLIACAHEVKASGVSVLDNFTGSAYCPDRDLVLQDGQRWFGVVLMTKLFTSAVAGPGLGMLADTLGRKPILLAGLGGFLSAGLLATTASTVGSGPIALGLLTASACLQGLTAIFGALFLAIGADVTKGKEDEQPAFFAAISATQAVAGGVGFTIAVAIERLNLLNYFRVWSLQFLVVCCILLVTWLCLEETLVREGSASSSSSNAVRGHNSKGLWASLGPLLRDRFLQGVLVGVSLACVGVAAGSIYASFTMAVYNWDQGDLQMWILGFGVMAVIAMAFAERIIDAFGPAHVVAYCFVVTGVDGWLKVLAPLQSPVGPGCLLTGIGLDMLTGPGIPAMNTIIARRFDTNLQAKTHALIGVCITLSIALSSPVYSWMFDPSAADFLTLSASFILSSVFTTAGNIVLASAICPILAEERLRPASSRDRAGGLDRVAGKRGGDGIDEDTDFDVGTPVTLVGKSDHELVSLIHNDEPSQ